MEFRALGGVSRLALYAGLSALFVAGAAPAQAQFGWFGGAPFSAAPPSTARYYMRGRAPRHHAVRKARTRTGRPAKDGKEEPAKPVVAPLTISIPVNRQHLTVYDGE